MLFDELLVRLAYQPGPLALGDLLGKRRPIVPEKARVIAESMDIIGLFNKVKPPYNINEASQQLGLEALQDTETVNNWIKEVVDQKVILIKEMQQLSYVEKIYLSDANFILVKVTNANALYDYLSGNEVIVRNRSKDVNCENCLRITIGTPEENKIVINLLKTYQP